MGAASSWLRHRGSTSSIVSIVFAINQDDDEQLYVARWPKFFPAPESAASLPEAAVPSKKRAANAVATLESRGDQSTKTRRGMAAAGEKPTVATTDRMLLVDEAVDAASPSSTCPTIEQGSVRSNRPVVTVRSVSYVAADRELLIMEPGIRTCRSHHCGRVYVGSKRTPCPHCGRQVT